MSAAVPLPRPEPIAEIVTVTPELAEQWLGKNTHNRSLKFAKIDQYARDIVDGRWRLTGEAIKFDSAGRLLDGQNRLHAVIRAGKPIETMVVRGLRGDAQEVMDSGTARTASDVLALAGVRSANRVAGAARIAMSVERTGRSGMRFSNSEVLDWVQAHLEITEAPRLLGSDARLIPVPPAVRVYVAYRFTQVDADAANDFLAQLATGVGVASSDAPAVACRRRLTGNYGRERRTSTDDQIAFVFRAWNAWRQGRSLGTTQGLRAGQKLPELV